MKTLTVSLVLVLLSCNGSSFRGGKKDKNSMSKDLIPKPAQAEIAADPNRTIPSGRDLIRSDDEQPSVGNGAGAFANEEIAEEVDNRSDEVRFCQDGPKIALSGTGIDYGQIFTSLCTEENKFSEAFIGAIDDAYRGAGDPIVNVVNFEVGADYQTRIVIMYGLLAPLSSPAYLSDINIWQVLEENGVEASGSRLELKVESRQELPGQGSLEAIRLHNRIVAAEGAGIYDIRKSEVNTFLFREDDRSLTMTTEHLVDKEQAPYYADAKQVIAGLATNIPGRSLFVYATELNIKDRIDPARIRDTFVKVNQRVQQITYATAEASGY